MILENKRPTLAALALALGTLGACGEADTETNRPGNPAVHERIAALTDCTELQREFDTAMVNLERQEAGTDGYTAVLEYAKHAEDRRGELGCAP